MKLQSFDYSLLNPMLNSHFEWGDFAFWVLLLSVFLLERSSEGKGEGMISAAQRIISFITKDAA